MTQAIEIASTTPYVIHGTLYEITSRTSSKGLIINIHGLTHSQWGYLQQNSIPAFNEAGYDVFNFSFYDRLPSSRRLSQTTLQTQREDLERVIEHFKTEYKNIFLTAHSLGALTTLMLNPQGVKAVSLWDPAFDVTHFWSVTKCLTQLPEYNAYKLDYGSEFLISPELVEEIKNYPHKACLELAANFKSPAQKIIPETSIFAASPHISCHEYDTAFTNGYERTTINDTDHCFYGTNKDKELFEYTTKWFDIY